MAKTAYDLVLVFNCLCTMIFTDYDNSKGIMANPVFLIESIERCSVYILTYFGRSPLLIRRRVPIYVNS